MANTHKLAFIGPAKVHEAFKQMDENWDMQIPLESLSAFEKEISQPEDSKISSETSVIIFFSRLFNQNPQKFAELVAFYAPYSVICILTPEQEWDSKNTIEKAIKEAQKQEVSLNPDYNINTPFFFVRYGNAQEDILNAIEQFTTSPLINEEYRATIRTMLPSANLPIDDAYVDFDDDDIVDIPMEMLKPPKDARGKVITVTSSKGGSGKSTVSVALGAYIAKASKNGAIKGLTPAPLKVCIIDLDVRDGQLGFLNGVMRPNIIDILLEGDPTAINIKKGLYTSEKLDCDFIFAAKRPRNASEIPNNFYVAMIQNLRYMYDVIILDTSVNYLDPLLEDVAYPLADHIVLVSDMGISSVFGCTRWIQEIIYSDAKTTSNRIPPEKVSIVINKAMPDLNMSPERLEQATKGLPIIGMIPQAPTVVTYAANTSSLGQILNVEYINKAFNLIATTVLSQILPDVKLGEVPYTISKK